MLSAGDAMNQHGPFTTENRGQIEVRQRGINHSPYTQSFSRDARVAVFSDLAEKAERHYDQLQQDPPVVPHREDSETFYDAVLGLSCVCSESGRSVTSEHIMERSLLRGRLLGWRIFRKLAFPPLHNLVRCAWIVIQWLIAVFLFSLSTATYTLGNRDVSNKVHLSLSAFAVVLAMLDAVWVTAYLIWRCRGAARGRRIRNEMNISLVENEDNESDMHNIPSSAKKDMCSTINTVLDFLRMIVSELILFPLVVCDVYTLISKETYLHGSTADWVAFAELMVSSISLILFVYVARLLVLGVMFYNVHQQRAPPSGLGLNKEQLIQAGYDSSIRTSGLCYQVFLSAHVVAQMINQICMIIAIGVKIYDKNNDYYYYWDAQLGYLWFMMAAGYLLPTVGLWMFFIVTHYWLQQYAIGITVNMISLLNLPGVGRVFFPGCSDAEIRLKTAWIIEYVNFDTLSTEFHAFKSQSTGVKLWYPFKNWAHVIICFVYAAMQSAFIAISVLSINSIELNSGVFITASVIEVLADLYPLAVTAFWVIVIAGICVVILLMLSTFKIWIWCLIFYANSSPSRQRTVYIVQQLPANTHTRAYRPQRQM